MFEHKILFQYAYDGWLFKGVNYKGRFLVLRKNPRKLVWQRIFSADTEQGLDKYKNREVHPVRNRDF